MGCIFFRFTQLYFFWFFSDPFISELIHNRLLLFLKEAKAQEGALERFIRFLERYSDNSSGVISAGVLC